MMLSALCQLQLPHKSSIVLQLVVPLAFNFQDQILLISNLVQDPLQTHLVQLCRYLTGSFLPISFVWQIWIIGFLDVQVQQFPSHKILLTFRQEIQQNQQTVHNSKAVTTFINNISSVSFYLQRRHLFLQHYFKMVEQ